LACKFAFSAVASGLSQGSDHMTPRGGWRWRFSRFPLFAFTVFPLSESKLTYINFFQKRAPIVVINWFQHRRQREPVKEKGGYVLNIPRNQPEGKLLSLNFCSIRLRYFISTK
jgi:hypothetical protein